MVEKIVRHIRDLYQTESFIPLHEPRFVGREKEFLNDCIDSTFVSSIGEYVDRFEHEVANFTGSRYAVATVNGTSALHTALILAGIGHGDEVITQALTFVATCNAIAYTGAHPVFVDVERESLGLSAEKLEEFLKKNCTYKKGDCVNKLTGRAIKAIIPMHTFGMPAKMHEILEVADAFGLKVIEDAAESLGSFVHGRHTGTLSWVGTLSFNGNKVITCGGGGMLLTNDEQTAKRAKHLTTTAKAPHKWEFWHDQLGYNYRMPNINAALGCAQMEGLSKFLHQKRDLARIYKEIFENMGFQFVTEWSGASSNYWLNTILAENREERDFLLEGTNSRGVMTRPAWRLMTDLPMYRHMQHGDLSQSQWLEDRIVNIPSSVRV